MSPVVHTPVCTLAVKPLGYPDTAAICGASGCDAPASVWLTTKEASAYQAGERVFGLPTAAMKVKVAEVE
jgi:hypothetical protein